MLKNKLKQKISLFFTLLFLIFTFTASASSLDDAKYYIKKYYVENISDEKLNADNIPDLIKNLNDPYSGYFTRDEFQDFIGLINQSYVGIGVTIEKHQDGLVVTGVFDNSPAKKVGIKAGDVIFEVDGTSIKGMEIEKATSLIKGKENTYVEIKVKREGEILVFNIMRQKIEIATAKGELLDGHIGYIQMTSFGQTTKNEFLNAYNSLKQKGADIFILDIRDNGGGFLQTAVEILQQFIGDKTAVILKDKYGNEQNIYGSKPVKLINDRFILLINKNSASASEVTAAALKDYNKALLIGTRTFGKGTVQNFFELEDGDVLKLTIQKFYSPKDNEINKVGVTPHIYTEEDAKKIALMLAAKKPVSDNTGYVKFVINGVEYFTKLNNKDEFNKFINLLDECDFYIGYKNTWIKKNINDYWQVDDAYTKILSEVNELKKQDNNNSNQTKPETNTKPKVKADNRKYGYVNISKLNLRLGPSTKYKAAAVLNKDVKVEVLGVDGNWVKVNYNGKVGYVYKKYLTIK